MSGDLSGLGLGERAEQTSPESKAPGEGRAAEENTPRRPTEREGKTELRDVVDDVFLRLFQRLVKTDLKTLYALESTCRRLRRLAKHKAVYKACTHVKLEKDQPLSLAPGFEPLEGQWERVLAHLRQRGAKLSILELKGIWGGHYQFTKGLRTLATDGTFLWYVKGLAFGVGGMGPDMSSVECLVLSLSQDLGSFLTEIARHFFLPERFPALRVLIIRGGSDADSQDLWAELCEKWKDGTTLVCFKTPLPQHSFLKGPKDQPPHPDLLRLSQRYEWAH